MINLEHKLTVDDLIVEYLISKVKNGYEPSFLTSEFFDFLNYFRTKMDLELIVSKEPELFIEFYKRKTEYDWFSMPHVDIEYSKQDKEYVMKANYKLSNFDKSVINTYFIDNGIGKYGKGKTAKIRNIIKEYLELKPKRQIDDTIELNNNDLIIGKTIAANIILNIWNSYTNNLINNKEWPRQCTDINKYLFDIDLSKIIGLKPLKPRLIELYMVISKRIGIMYHQDNNLKISSYQNKYLARSNYELLIRGYEKIIGIAYGETKKSLEIDLSNFRQLQLTDEYSTSKQLVRKLEKSNKN